MKKLLLTSVMALSMVGGAHAGTYLNWDAYDKDTNPHGMSHLDFSDPAPGAEHNFNLLQDAVNKNAQEFDHLHEIIAEWNKYFFGEDGDGTSGLFHDFYSGNAQFGMLTETINAKFGQLESSINALDEKIHDMNKDLSAGIASVAALSSVAVADVKRGEVSVGGGYGYHNGQSAAAFGLAVGLTDNWSMNAGAGLSSADTTFRAGTNYKFKLF